MPPTLDYLWWPLAACLVIALIHNYLGLHVLERKVIFVDLALAQIAALGATFAFLLGFAPKTTGSYLSALLFTVFGAAVFAVTRMRRETIPQEAVIGIAYAVASAATIVLVDAAQDPHGAEHIKELLAGAIIWVEPDTVLAMGGLYLGLGGFHWIFRKRFIALTDDPEGLRRAGVRVPVWDFLFYLVFGLVITMSVQTAGILLVFSFLIVPGAVASLFSRRWSTRLLGAWVTSLVVSVVGLLLSYDRPTGPVVVVLFGIVLAGAGVVYYVRAHDRTLAAVRNVCAGAVALVVAVVSLNAAARHWAAQEHEDDHSHAHEQATPSDMERYEALKGGDDEGAGGALSGALTDPSDLVREGAIDQLLERGDPASCRALTDAFAREPLESLRLRIGLGFLKLGDPAAYGMLVEVLASAEFPMTRDGALTALQELAGQDFGYDAFAEPEANREAVERWREWAARKTQER